MKNLYLTFLAALFIFLSCSSDDDNTENIPQTIEPEVRILGEWKLIFVFQVSSPPNRFDYSNDNIIFDFKSNGTFTVTGNDDPSLPSLYYTNGEYTYEFIERYYIDPDGVIPFKALKFENNIWDDFAFDIEGDYGFGIEGFDFIVSDVGTDGPLYGFIRN